MAETQKLLYDQARAVQIGIWLFRYRFVRRTVQSVDRTEYTELNMTHEQLVILFSHHVSADIVAPPSIADIARRKREIRQISKRIPRDIGIARKAERIAVRTDSRITR